MWKTYIFPCTILDLPVTHKILQWFANQNTHTFIKKKQLQFSFYYLDKVPTQLGEHSCKCTDCIQLVSQTKWENSLTTEAVLYFLFNSMMYKQIIQQQTMKKTKILVVVLTTFDWKRCTLIYNAYR